MAKREIVLQNQYYRYSLLVAEDGHVHQNSFLPADCAKAPQNEDRAVWKYPYEVILATSHGGKGGESVFDASYGLIFQEHVREGDTDIIRLRHEEMPLEVQLCYEVRENSPALVRYTRLINHGREEIVLDQVSSFVLDHIPYFGLSEKMLLHTYRSAWAWEGEEEVRSFRDLNLFSNFCRTSFSVENNSAFTTARQFPYFVLEDPEEHLLWGVQLENDGQWRFEISIKNFGAHNWYCAQGGLPSFTGSGWSKTLRPDESYETPKASLVTADNIDEIYNRMHTHQHNVLIRKSLPDQTLPVVYNDWQGMKGEVSGERILAQLDKLQNLGIEVYVTDAGWYVPPGGNWSEYVGCWQYNQERFPDGLESIVKAIRAHGMIPGIWCEIEMVGEHCPLWDNSEALLTCRGRFIQCGPRRFLNFTNPVARQHADDAIAYLYGMGFRYLKIDFNADCAPGCDGADVSAVENLRQNRVAYGKWMQTIRKAYPDLIVEHCSSGGMRLDYSHLSRACLASITDQENYLHMAEVFYNVSRLIHPNQCGNWSNILSDFDYRTAQFTMTNSMMGRLCVSGVVSELTEDVLDAVKDAIAFYKRHRFIIDDPLVYYHTPPRYYKQPQDLKIMEYQDRRTGDVLLYVSSTSFAGEHVCVPHLQGYRIADCYPDLSGIVQEGDSIRICVPQAEPFGKVLFLQKEA